MKSLISIWDTTKNFWDLNPMFKNMEFFKDVYKDDRDRSKPTSKSSKKMWFIACYLDFGSVFADLDDNPEADFGRQRIVSKSVMDDELYWEKNREWLEKYFEMYELFCLTPAQRSLRAWYNKLRERDQVLAETKYVVGQTDAGGKLINSNVAILDTMLTNTGKVWDQYFKVKEIIDSEGSSSQSRGGAEESASDRGAI